MTTDYDDGNIRVLEGLEAVRVRPGMYIGGTGSFGLHNLVYGVVSKPIDEAFAGRCHNIDISINVNGSITILDDGGWISTEIYPQTEKSTIELLFTVFYIGCRRVEGYQTSDWFYGGEIPVVSALSSHVEVKVWRGRKIYIQRFECGIAVSELETLPSQDDRTGTMITFSPDPKIFKDGIEFEFDTLACRFRQLAFVNAGIKISLTDYRREALMINDPKAEDYYYQGGLRDYVAYLNAEKQPLHEEVIYVKTEKNKVRVEVALQWCFGTDENILGFANTVETKEGGTHLEGLKMAVTLTLNQIAHQRSKLQSDDANLAGKYICQGLTAIISVMLLCPEFEGTTRTRLVNRQVRGIVNEIVFHTLTRYLASRRNIADAIITRAIKASDAAEIARTERELLRHQVRTNNLHPS